MLFRSRRVLYNRASADLDGNPWSERKRWVWWDAGRGEWVGYDVPDFAPTKAPNDPGDPTDPNDPNDPDPNNPDGRYLQPLPEGFETPLLDEEFVVRLEWQHLTQERPLVSRSVDLELIYCVSPPGVAIDRHHTEACSTWTIPQNTWRIDGESYTVRTGGDATRDGIAEQVGHLILHVGRTYVGVLYHSGGYNALGTVRMYHRGEQISEELLVLTAPGQMYYVASMEWGGEDTLPERLAAPLCRRSATQRCDDNYYLDEIPLYLDDPE